MKTLISLEELAQFVLGIWLFSLLDYAWWRFPALILAPDLSMIGYLGGPKVGAWVYNFFHHKLLATGLILIGFYLKNDPISFAGAILFAHAAMDRVFGYGLKYETSFHDTHLGKIGRQ